MKGYEEDPKATQEAEQPELRIFLDPDITDHQSTHKIYPLD